MSQRSAEGWQQVTAQAKFWKVPFIVTLNNKYTRALKFTELLPGDREFLNRRLQLKPTAFDWIGGPASKMTGAELGGYHHTALQQGREETPLIELRKGENSPTLSVSTINSDS
jgi:hypothetical protein